MSNDLITAAEAARTLGVKPATLYAYVSRGLVAVRRVDGDRRSWFRRDDVETLRLRGREPRRPGTEVRIASAITLIEPDRYAYRGTDPVALAGAVPFEAVCGLLWTGTLVAASAGWAPDTGQLALARAVTRLLPASALPIDRIRVGVPAIATLDPLRFDVRPEAPAMVGPRLLSTVVAALLPVGEDDPAPVAHRLAAALGTPGEDAAHAVDAALVLLADHELAASTMAARLAASFHADPYAAVTAGLATLSGARHGAASLAVEALIDELVASGDAAMAMGDRLRRGDEIAGLGHPLYPAGDPRAVALFTVLDGMPTVDPAVRQAVAVLRDAVRDRGLPAPNIDLALGALTRGLGMVRGAGEAIFAVARTAGWLAHIAEEYANRSDLRFRATYLPADIGV